MNSGPEPLSLTERSYWERVWEAAELPRLFDPADQSVGNHGNMAFHGFFSDVLRMMPLQNASLVEIGCAQSKWLPYFCKEHGLAVTGIDYSQLGCTRAREMLRRAGCTGEIVQADIFSPPGDLRLRFDAVLSMGLVEHFADTASAVEACAALAKPGGLVITTIPNMAGVLGWAQRWIDRSVYEKHVPLDREALREAHEKCGLSVLRSEYLLSANFAVVNHANLLPKVAGFLVRGLLVFATAGVWVLERMIGQFPATRFFSPYVACVARKSGANS